MACALSVFSTFVLGVLQDFDVNIFSLNTPYFIACKWDSDFYVGRRILKEVIGYLSHLFLTIKCYLCERVLLKYVLSMKALFYGEEGLFRRFYPWWKGGCSCV